MSFDESMALPEGWKLLSVAQLMADDILEKPLDGNHGGLHPKASDYVDEGIPFIMASDLKDGQVDFLGCSFISEEQANSLRKGFAKAGDVLLSHKATIGRTAIVQENGHPFVMLTPQVTYYRVKDNKQLNPFYLQAFFDSEFFQAILAQWAGAGSTRAYLGITGQLKLPIIVPPIDFQVELAGHTNALNKKIRINNQINYTLEQMAQVLFKSWFVDFEPVKAKIAARQRWQALQSVAGPASPVCYAAELNGQPELGDLDTYMNCAAMQAISGKTAAQLDVLSAEDPERYNELYETAELFPSAMQESELGEIPEGWDCLALDQIAKYKNGLALQNFRPESEDDCLPVVKISQLKKGWADGEENASSSINPECIINNGDVVFSWSGSLMVDTWCGGKAALNQHLFKVTSSIYPKWLYFHFTRHHLEEFQRIAADKAVTMGHIKREHLKQALCAVPDVKKMSIGKAIDLMFEQQINFRLESLTLTELRNTLLPKLLSGEISLANRSEV